MMTETKDEEKVKDAREEPDCETLRTDPRSLSDVSSLAKKVRGCWCTRDEHRCKSAACVSVCGSEPRNGRMRSTHSDRMEGMKLSKLATLDSAM
jgi:hypothetical protein